MYCSYASNAYEDNLLYAQQYIEEQEISNHQTFNSVVKFLVQCR